MDCFRGLGSTASRLHDDHQAPSGRALVRVARQGQPAQGVSRAKPRSGRRSRPWTRPSTAVQCGDANKRIVVSAATAHHRDGHQVAGTDGHHIAGAVTVARALLRAGDADGALREAVASVEALQTLPARSEALAILAQVHLARGDAERALQVAEEAMELLRALGALPDADALVRLVHAEALRAVGQEHAALEAIGAARDRLLERAASIEDEEMRRSFLENVEIHQRTFSLASE